MKFTAKATTVAAMLLATITGNEPKQATPIQEVAHLVTNLNESTQQIDISVEQVFDSLSQLANSIQNLNAFLVNNKFKLKSNKYDELIHIRRLLDVSSSLMVSKYEDLIFETYFETYRKYSNAIANLDLNIYKINEKQGKVSIVNIAKLGLSADEINAIEQQSDKMHEVS